MELPKGTAVGAESYGSDMPLNQSDMFYVVEPYANGQSRFREATTVLSEPPTAEAAFAELARLIERLRSFNISADQFQWVVVDAERRPVRGH